MPNDDEKTKSSVLEKHESVIKLKSENVTLEVQEVIKRTAEVLKKTNEILVQSSKSQSRQQITNTLIGSFIGFVLAIGLFFITEYVRDIKEKENLEKLFIHECKYNLFQINITILDLRKLKEAIAEDIEYTETPFGFLFLEAFTGKITTPDIRMTFFNKSVDSGLLYAKMNYKDIPRYEHFISYSKSTIMNIENIKNDIIKAYSAQTHSIVMDRLKKLSSKLDSEIKRHKKFQYSIEKLIQIFEKK